MHVPRTASGIQRLSPGTLNPVKRSWPQTEPGPLPRLLQTHPGLCRLNAPSGIPKLSQRKPSRGQYNCLRLYWMEPCSEGCATSPKHRRRWRRRRELLMWRKPKRKRKRRQALPTRRTLSCSPCFLLKPLREGHAGSLAPGELLLYCFFANAHIPSSSLHSSAIKRF